MRKEKMAEDKGFEPSKELPPYTLSKRAPSTTRPILQTFKFINMSVFISKSAIYFGLVLFLFCLK